MNNILPDTRFGGFLKITSTEKYKYPRETPIRSRGKRAEQSRRIRRASLRRSRTNRQRQSRPARPPRTTTSHALLVCANSPLLCLLSPLAGFIKQVCLFWFRLILFLSVYLTVSRFVSDLLFLLGREAPPNCMCGAQLERRSSMELKLDMWAQSMAFLNYVTHEEAMFRIWFSLTPWKCTACEWG